MKNKGLKILSILLTTAVLCSGCQSVERVQKQEKSIWFCDITGILREIRRIWWMDSMIPRMQ